MISAHQKLLLRSLQFPSTDTIQISNDCDFRHLIAWLEHRKIRYYTPEDRLPISDVNSEVWPAAFSKYLHELECPMESFGGPAESQKLLDWLLHYAVDLMHGDKELGPVIISNKDLPASRGEKESVDNTVFLDAEEPHVRAAVDVLLEYLGLKASDASVAHKLAAARDILAEEVLPALKDMKLQQSRGKSAGGSVLLDLCSYPLGFSLGDEKTNLAAKLLRILYIKDLRALQTQIDDIIVQIQEFTANPRISAGLGVVGR